MIQERRIKAELLKLSKYQKSRVCHGFKIRDKEHGVIEKLDWRPGC